MLKRRWLNTCATLFTPTDGHVFTSSGKSDSPSRARRLNTAANTSLISSDESF